ncbi:MAG: amidase [Dehalococcoidia bacterium]|nr:amidase [Dehalococcoidia bacterium]
MQQEQLAFAPAAELGRLIARRKVSPVELTRLFLERIGRLNPRLNAYQTVDERVALAAARAAERAVLRGEVLGPLHGVPLSVKDLFATRGLTTTRGSLLYRDSVPSRDALPVQRLRKAGMVILGKTSTSEFGFSATTENGLIGATLNPWDRRATAGGSSGGAAAAVAGGLGPLALGSDGGGSIRIPSSFCGVFGLKPTKGRVARSNGPASAVWSPWIQPGPITRTVEDAALLLQAMAGPDPGDPYSLRQPPPNFRAGLDAGAKGLRIAWSPDLGYAAVDPEVAAAVRRAAKAFARMGAEVEPAELDLGDPFPPFWTVFTANAYAALGHLLEQQREMLGELTIVSLEAGMLVTGAEFSRALADQEVMAARVTGLFERCDIFLTPATAVPAFPVGKRPTVIAGRKVDPLWSFTPFAFPFSVTGHPAASVPCGFTRDGLPIGLQVVGRLGDEVTLLRACAAYEAEHPWADRRPPGL